MREAQSADPDGARPANGTPSTYSRPCSWSGKRRSTDARGYQSPSSARHRPSLLTPPPRPVRPRTVTRYDAPACTSPVVQRVLLDAGTLTVSDSSP